MNQFMHLISSTIFIFNYCTIWDDCRAHGARPVQPLPAVRPRHLQPPCHDEEELLSVQRLVQVLRRRHALARRTCSSSAAPSLRPGPRARRAKLAYVTAFFVLGHTGLLWMQYGFRITMVWLVKLITDPFTDVAACYPAR